ncbi:tetratricopeptide repeat protein [Chryseobacterium sp. MYb7]|uniref:tetratricopeptide repeat protein n=1 Tax=Chryseobacterium sp. MYb7 TaxID=1827290 RepID=UPI0013FE332F|nr:hypothetical protein [Chryseobacterium sp. MYb7]
MIKIIFFFFPVFLLGQQKITSQYIESEIKKVHAVKETGNTNEYIKKNTILLRDSKQINYSKGIATSALNFSDIYFLLGNYKKSLYYLELAKKEKYTKDNIDMQVDIKMLYSYNYSVIDLYQEAISELKEVVVLSDEIKEDSLRIYAKSKAYSVIGAVYLEKEQFDLATLYMKNAVNVIEKSETPGNKLQRSLIWYYLVLANVKIEENKIDSADKYVKIAEARPKKLFGNNNFKLYETKGRIHDKRKEYKSAIDDYQKALKLAEKTNIAAAIALYKLISDVYTKLGNKESATEYLQKYTSISDSLANAKQPTLESTVKHLITQKEKGIKDNNKFLFYGVYIGVFGLILFIFFIAKRLYKKNKILSTKEQERQLLNQKLNIAFEEVVQLAKSNNPEFLTRFQEVYPIFFQNLLQIEPQLLNTELKFCALIFLNFSTKDIASYTFVQPSSIQTRKNRLRKKLNIPSDEDLYVWMKNINTKI